MKEIHIQAGQYGNQIGDKSGSASPNHYHDIESLTLALGKSRPGRKTSKDKRQSSIWTDTSEIEREKANTAKKSKTPINSTPESKFKVKKNSKFAQKSLPPLPPTFLENPLVQNELKNWTLPRVELWCTDPNCLYNQHLWGNHYQHSPGSYPPGTILEVEEEEVENENSEPESTRINSYYSQNSDNSTHNHEDTLHSASTMVLNPHRHNQKMPPTESQMHLNMTMRQTNNNVGSKDGITITHTNTNKNSKAANAFTNPNGNPTGRAKGNMTMTQTHTPKDTIGSSITSNSNTTDTTMLTIPTGSSIGSDESPISPEGSSVSTIITGFDTSSTSITGSRSGSSGSGGVIPSKPVGHDIVTGNPRNNATGHNIIYNQSQTNNTPYNHPHHQHFRSPSSASSNPYCRNCKGVVPLNHLDDVSDIGHGGRLKGNDPGFWHFNKFQHPLQRDHSFHSVGGFTLNGQYNTIPKKPTMVKFCSSHKISLVVSTFSLIVTIGLLITLFLMKKRGMMDTMMDN